MLSPRRRTSRGLSSCTDIDVELGWLEYGGSPVRIEVSTTASVDESLAVRVTTYGDHGCVSFATTHVAPTADGADVWPYDQHRTPGEHEGCILFIQSIPHDVTLRFDAPGTKTLRVHGRSACSEAGCEKTVEVPVTLF